MSHYIKCPHCGTRLRVRTSREASTTVRELYLQCENVECAFTVKAHLALVNTIAPSMRPRPSVFIPLSRSAERRQESIVPASQLSIPGLATQAHPRDMPTAFDTG